MWNCCIQKNAWNKGVQIKGTICFYYFNLFLQALCSVMLNFSRHKFDLKIWKNRGRRQQGAALKIILILIVKHFVQLPFVAGFWCRPGQSQHCYKDYINDDGTIDYTQHLVLKWVEVACSGWWTLHLGPSGLKWLIKVVWSGQKWSEVVWIFQQKGRCPKSKLSNGS